MHVALLGTGVQPIPPTGYGGVERTLAELAEALRASGHSVTVLQQVRRGRSSDEYRFAWHLPELLGNVPYDVVHASTPVVANRLAGLGLPFVYTSHSRHWFEPGGLGGRWGLWLERRAVRKAARTIALTARLQARILQQVGPSVEPRLRVVPIGVDTERFRPDWDERTGRRALGVGIVRPFKRWELAARALAGSGWELTIVGPTPDPAYADALRRIGPHVRLTGQVPDDELLRAYARSDVLLHPSRVELLAGAVIQGLSAGLPVFGAEPVRDLIPPEAGSVAPPGSTEAQLEEALRRWIGPLFENRSALRRMGEHGRATAAERFSWTNVARAHEAVYREVVADPTTRGRSPSP